MSEQSIKSEIEKLINSDKVVIFSKTTCPFCKKVKALFDSLNVKYTVRELDQQANTAQVQDVLEKLSGQRTVPNVYINKKHIGGHDDTVKLHKEGKLMPLLSSVSASDYDYDLIVIGGGSGGLSASKRAAELGKKVAVLDFVRPTPLGTSWGLGGTCVNVGCIPKKLMHQAAILGHSLSDARKFGWQLPAEKVNHNWSELVQPIQDYIGSLNWGYKVQLRDKNVTYFNATGEFADAHTIKATNRRGKETKMTADKFVIAVGERPRYPDIPGAKEFCITSDDLFSLTYCPGKTLLIGASYVSLECAGFLKAVGLDVTVMVRSIFLRGFDQQMAEKVGEYMEKNEGIQFYKKRVPLKVERLEEGKPGRFLVTSQDTETKAQFTAEFNTVIFAIGRYSDTKPLGLDLVGIKANQNGKIAVNSVEQTSAKHIYCIGDNAEGKPELTPVAIQAGKLLAERLYAGSTTKCDYVNVPTTVFTPLEYSSCGYSEEAATEKFGAADIEVYHSNFWPLEWTVPGYDSNICYAKAITNKKDKERVVGIHYLGPNAGEIMQGFAAAMKCGLTKELLDSTIGIHPTTAEIFTTLTVTKRSGGGVEKSGC